MLAIGACTPAASTPPPDGAGPGSAAHFGTFTAAWSVQNVDGSPATCESGFDTMKVSANPWDDNLGGPDPSATPIVGMFDCVAGSGTMQLQIDGMLGDAALNGKYDITWEETDSTGNTTVATDVQSELDYETTVDLSSGAATSSVTMYQDGGYAWIGWALYGMTSTQFLDSCAGAGVDMIGLELTEMTSNAVTNLMFPCGTSDNTTSGVVGQPVDELDQVGGGVAPVLAGFYTIVATAYASGQAVGTSDGHDDINVTAPNVIQVGPELSIITLTNR
ncbi:MAG TPA: hypothetical protein VGG74_20445 [Kofleriaceae bacterium]